MRRSRLKPTIELPPVDTAAAPYREGPETYPMKPSEVRETAPYAPGDVVWTLTRHDGQPRLAVIERVFSHLLERWAYWIPCYRARLLNRDGKAWSGRWQYIYPGDIERGYQKAGRD